MIIYLAAPWKYRAQAKVRASQLRDHGHQIVSRWHDEWAEKPDAAYDHPEQQTEAEKDVMDVKAAEVVLVLNLEKSEGKAVEQGIALARGIPIVVVGERTNVFHHLRQVRMVSDFDEALRWLDLLL